MEPERIDLAGIDNLIALWEAMGAGPRAVGPVPLRFSLGWPHRCWAAPGAPFARVPSPEGLARLEQRCVVPVWGLSCGDAAGWESALDAARFTLAFRQTTMYLRCDSPAAGRAADPDRGLETVTSPAAIASWTAVCAAAFGYPVDAATIERLARHAGATLLLARAAGEPVATAILFRTGPVVGVHQVGVLPSHRGRGIARAMMGALIRLAFSRGAGCITLQSSVMGEPLYRRLGFELRFGVDYYRRAAVAGQDCRPSPRPAVSSGS